MVRISLAFFILFIALPFSIMAQFDYNKAWQKIDTLLDKGLPKSAMEEVDKLYNRSKRENNQPQWVKATVAKASLTRRLEEDEWKKSLTILERETAQAPEPVKQILQSITAELYWDYLRNQRWKIYERRQSTQINPNDPDTWSIPDFHTRIGRLFELSMRNPKLLQQTPTEKFAAALWEGNARKLRPTLYDLLTHRVLDYLENSESEISKPLNAFVFNDYASLNMAKPFVRHAYETTDSASHVFKAIGLYQNLARFHLTDSLPDALIHLEMRRINFVMENNTNPYKDRLYREWLENMYAQYKINAQGVEAGTQLAQWWKEKADAFVPEISAQEYKMGYVVAAQIAGDVYKRFPESKGGREAYNLLQEITKPHLNIEIEKVNVIREPFRIKLAFQNTNAVYFRLLRLPYQTKEIEEDDEDYAYNYYQENWWKQMTAKQPLKQWMQALPATADLREHSAELKVDGLESGKYLLIASSDASFPVDTAALCAVKIYVSDISFLNCGHSYFLLHRKTGLPLSGARVQLWQNVYDYQSRTNRLVPDRLLIADKNGKVAAEPGPEKKGFENYRLQITHEKDQLFMDEGVNLYHFNPQKRTAETEAAFQKKNARFFIFTDRLLYRPGQLVYFKAVGITRSMSTNQQKAYVPAEKIKLVLTDAQGQKIDTLSLSANAYGSFQGKFRLPASGLTGNFRIEIESAGRRANAYFRVEEYKRPRFYVSIETPAASPGLGDSITVEGKATAYAGNAIDGAEVTYRVYRQARWIMPLWVRGRGRIWPPYQNQEPAELAQGKTRTAADGSFAIPFVAEPDGTVSKSSDPIFDFVVEASVVDLNGETHESEITVPIGYKSLLLSVSPENGYYADADSSHAFAIDARNLQGITQKLNTTWKLYSLKAPQRPLRSRYWDAPDTSVMTKEQFVQLFPYDPYADEDAYQNWPKDALVREGQLNATDNGKLNLPAASLATGYYLLEASTVDKNGQTISAVCHYAVYQLRTRSLPGPLFHLSLSERSGIQPGQMAALVEASSVAPAFVVQQVSRNNNGEAKTVTDFHRMTEPLQRLQFAATEADRGGFLVQRFFVLHNRAFTNHWTVDVPWSNKKLQLEWQSFRNKTQPGSPETWKLTLKGTEGEKVAAEMLASMYDASLDAIHPHQWERFFPWERNNLPDAWQANHNFSHWSASKYEFDRWKEVPDWDYDRLMTVSDWFYERQRNFRMLQGKVTGVQVTDLYYDAAPSAMEEVGTETVKKDLTASVAEVTSGFIVPKKEEPPPTIPVIRKNFNETAFFYPTLTTDSSGSISFSFTMPEALTTWKLQLLAHTPDLRIAQHSETILTQKDLMVQPNLPRFFRQGDNMELTCKVVNLSERELTGTVTLELLNASTLQPVDGWFQNVFPNQYFTAPAGQSTGVKFPISIPVAFADALVCRLVAQTKGGSELVLSDGEEMTLPILSNRMLVTETLPLNVRNTTSRSFTWPALLNSEKSSTLQHHSFSVEFTSNPAWLAVKALPYLTEYSYDCAEQTWNRLYANALAAHLVARMPKVKSMIAQWKTTDTSALLSQLQKNQNLKSALLEETPWVLDAKNEQQQRQNLTLLFDMVRMANDTERDLKKLEEMQLEYGAFTWFKGGPEDRYITQYIATGIGRLKKSNALPPAIKVRVESIAAKAQNYLARELAEDHRKLKASKADLTRNQLGNIQLQFLYMRSFFPEWNLPEASREAYDYYFSQALKYWNQSDKQQQGMTALVAFRSKQPLVAKGILKSLRENATLSEEFGMYWKEFNNPSFYWWQAPVESHALLLEAFAEIENDTLTINDLKTWLLKQKQTTHWSTTKATADACHALLTTGSNWLDAEPVVGMKAGGLDLTESKKEAGTGYFMRYVPVEKINPSLGKIDVTLKHDNPKAGAGLSAWGAAYWQYFEELNSIQAAASPLALKKYLTCERMTPAGPKLQPVESNTLLKPGDKVVVRLEINSDRNLEYIHLKDMRAACFEPMEALSGYRWQGGLGYYQSPRDASMNYFIHYLPRGNYVLEYALRVTHEGQFSNGISTLQCMYAPEFSSHSAGQKVEVGR
jgi:hypothetical protein